MTAPTRLLQTVALAGLLLPMALAGQEEAPPSRRSGLEISPFVGVYNDTPEFDPDGSAVFVDPAGNPLFGGFLGYHFAGGLFLEGEVGSMSLEMQPVGENRRDLDLLYYGGSLGYNFPLGDRAQLYPAIGLGQSRWSPERLNSESNFTVSYGGGVRVFIAPSVAIRVDARMRQISNALERTGALVSPVTPDQTFWAGTASVGVSFFVRGGGKAEIRDTDLDGVRDGVDACPGTPRGVRVDASGCSIDSDGDGVFDGPDRCADTLRGALVDVTGCALDGDRDGVPDGLDRCPNTPTGASVDDSGCGVDSDGDGVFDGLDRCPNTPAGTEVDARGCAVPVETPVTIPDPGPLPTFGNVTFEVDSSQLRADAIEALREVGRALMARPDASAVLYGHTDSTASEAYNEGLGRRRAESVRDFLVMSFPELATRPFEIDSFGEDRPIADNGTEAGRAKNRRVEITLKEFR
ncbi:MAG: OmpA family protein [Gemmatimonadota bacterium]|nr:MAG: OmpA family protein [Gemmatimonadota bacterium]